MKNDSNLENNNESTESKKIDFKSIMNMDLKIIKNKFSKGLKKSNKVTLPEKKRKVVAFDIGSSTIKIVEGMYYKKDLIIYKYVTVATPKGSVIDGEVKKEEELKNRLLKVLKENGIKAKHAICTTNSSLIINREISIPKVEPEEMDTVIRYEIQQYLPINLEDYILQGTILNEKETDDAKKLDMRVIAYPEKIARGYYNLLLKLDLKPYALDVNYNAVSKFINFTGINNEFENKLDDAIAFIDFGANTIDVNIYKNGHLDFTRIIKDCGNEIDEMLLERNQLQESEIENLKRNNIDLMDELEPINIFTKQIVDEWIEKIEKIIQFYKNRNVDNKLESIVVFGGSSKIRGIAEYMTDRLDIRTRIKGISKLTFKSSDDGEPIDDYINVIGSVIRNE
jgi:type IV pilus assembly protein PilM